MMDRSINQRGFTLVEMIMVIVIMGIIGGIVAVFLRSPVEGYVASARRAEMTDIADTALRRINRDLRSALPNSVRVTGTCNGTTTCYLEFLPTTGGGRYRASAAGGTGSCAGVAGNTKGDALSFTTADTCFEVLGLMPAVAAGSDEVVIYKTTTANLVCQHCRSRRCPGRHYCRLVRQYRVTPPARQCPAASCNRGAHVGYRCLDRLEAVPG